MKIEKLKPEEIKYKKDYEEISAAIKEHIFPEWRRSEYYPDEWTCSCCKKSSGYMDIKDMPELYELKHESDCLWIAMNRLEHPEYYL